MKLLKNYKYVSIEFWNNFYEIKRNFYENFYKHFVKIMREFKKVVICPVDFKEIMTN